MSSRLGPAIGSLALLLGVVATSTRAEAYVQYHGKNGAPWS